MFGPYRARGRCQPDGAARARRVVRRRCRPTARRASTGPRGHADPTRGVFFTDANGCVARAAWEQRAVPRGRLRRGPAAGARHARGRLREGLPRPTPPSSIRTQYSPLEQFRRSFDEWRGLREVHAIAVPPTPRGGCAGSAARDCAMRGRRRASARGLRAPPPRCATTAARGSAPRWARAPTRLPPRVRRRARLEGRAGFRSTSSRDVLMAGGSDASSPRPAADLWRRGDLTSSITAGGAAFRLVTFPLRLAALERGLRARPPRGDEPPCRAAGTARGPPRDHRDAHLRRPRPRSTPSPACAGRPRPGAARSWSSTTAARPSTRRGCGAARRLQLELARDNRGFAASVNRGLRARGPGDDVVVLNNDVIASAVGWSPPARRLPRPRHRRRRADAALSRRPHPVRRARPQPRRARVVRPSLPLQAPRPRAGERARHRRWPSPAPACT